MGISFAGCRDYISDQEEYNKFWDLNIKETYYPSSVLNCLEKIIQKTVNSKEVIIQYKYEDLKVLIDKFLITKDKDLIVSHREFWVNQFNEAAKIKKDFELIASIFILCKPDLKDFFTCYYNISQKLNQIAYRKIPKNQENGNQNLNNAPTFLQKSGMLPSSNCCKGEEPEVLYDIKIDTNISNKDKIKEFLTYYFNLISIKPLPIMKEYDILSNINFNNSSIIYNERTIKRQVDFFTLSEPENMDIFTFFKRHYYFLNNDARIREELRNNYKKDDDKDLTFNISHL